MPILEATLLALLAAAPQTPVIQDDIVVTASRSEQPRDQASAAVTLLDAEDLERLPAASLAEVLAFVPGVTMMFDSGASGLPMVTSRGFFGGGEVEYLKLMIDGVPVGDAESGNVDWARFRLADVERVEVLHGPGSALYGDTALGGVVQVFTSGSQGESGGGLEAGVGSFGAEELAGRYRTELASGWRLDASGGAWGTDGFRENADAEGRSGRLTFHRSGQRRHWRIDAEASRLERQQPGALTRDEIEEDREQSSDLFRFDGQTTTRQRLGVALDTFGATPLRVTLYGIRRDDDNLRTLLLAPGFGTSAFRALTTEVGGGTFEASKEWGPGVLRAGTDFERAELSAGYALAEDEGRIGPRVAAEDGRRDRLGVFLTGGWTFGRRTTLTAGARYDEIRDDLTITAANGGPRKETSFAWSPRVGLNVQLGPLASPGASPGSSSVSVFVQLSRAFKAPTLDQLFDQRPYPDGFGGTFTISNPDLEPQRAENVEVGVSRRTARSDWSVVGYRMNVEDEIDFDPQTFTYSNLGSSLHRGIEASVAVAKGARVSPRLTYAWTSVANRETPDVQLKNIPEHSARLLLHGRVTAKTDLDLVYRWQDALTLDDAGQFRSPSFSRVDLRLAHQWRRLRFEVDVLNALDEDYSELGYVLLDFSGQPTALEFPAPGRAFRLGASWTFQKKEKDR